VMILALTVKHKLYLRTNFVAKNQVDWAGSETRRLLWEVSD